MIDSRCYFAEIRRPVVEMVSVNVVDVVALLRDVMEGTEDEIVDRDMILHTFIHKLNFIIRLLLAFGYVYFLQGFTLPVLIDDDAFGVLVSDLNVECPW